MKERKIIGFKLLIEYPGSKSVGYFEKYDEFFSKYPKLWEPVYEEEKTCETVYTFGKQIKITQFYYKDNLVKIEIS